MDHELELSGQIERETQWRIVGGRAEEPERTSEASEQREWQGGHRDLQSRPSQATTRTLNFYTNTVC